MNEEDLKHLDSVLEHIETVQKYMKKIAKILLEQGDASLYRELYAAAQIHDNSKISNEIEFLYLRSSTKEKDPEKFFMALKCHQSNNSHHIEYHQCVSDMTDVQLIEMICDWRARSVEQNTNILDWVKEFCKIHNISKQGKDWKRIKKYINMLIEEKFK